MILIIAISPIIMLNAGSLVNFTCSDIPFINVSPIRHSIIFFNQKFIMKQVLHYDLNDFYFIFATEHLFSIFIVNSNFIFILSLWSNHVYTIMI